MQKIVLLFVVFFIVTCEINASIIEELDNPPEGAHQGQMFLGVLFNFGYPVGSGTDAEKKFLKNSTYTFEDSGTIKKFYIEHMYFSFGAMFEYMPIDYLGVYVRFQRSFVLQRTLFGSDYDNTSKTFYDDYTLMLGPSVHFTNRRWWDVSFTLMAGYSFGKYTATPVAGAIMPGYSGDGSRTANGIALGTELKFTAFFNGGLFLSVGFDWIMNLPTLNKGYDCTNPQTGATYPTSTQFSIHSFCLVIIAGYAFSN